MGIAHGNLWNEVAAMQVFTTFVFALALRFRGFRVRSIDTNRSVDSISGNSAPMQFSLAQILFWTAAIAPFLIAIKGLDYAFPRRLGWWHWWAVMAKGALLAPTVLVALWAALGNGQVRLKVFGLVLVGVATGLALVVVDRFLGTSRAGLGYGSADYYLSRVSRSTDAFLGWVAWTELAGFLLAGMLLVFRGTSYRLLRQGRPRLRKVP
jgi:hypothetical protein